MLSFTFISSDAQERDPGPEGPLVYAISQVREERGRGLRAMFHLPKLPPLCYSRLV